MNPFNLATNQTLQVLQALFVQTGTYQEQNLRPFNLNASKPAADALRSATRNGLNLGVSAVQEIASGIIAPAACVEGSVGIAEGWNSRRFRMMLKVNEFHPYIQGTTTQRIFYGYSDQCDASMNHLDPNMRIYFNSETIVAESIEPTIHGPQRRVHIVGSNQIVSPVDVFKGANAMFAKPTSFLIRPEDMFSLSQTRHVTKRLQNTNRFDGQIDVSYDHRTMVGEGGAFKYSNRRDTSPTRYISSSLNAWQHSIKEANTAASDDMGEYPAAELMLGDAANACRSSEITTNSFLARLRDEAGYMERGYVLFKDLCRIFPEMTRGDVTKWSMDNGQSIRKVSHAIDSQTWAGADNASIAASLLAQSIPSIMMDTFLRTCSFAVTNGTGHNNYRFEIHENNTKSIIDGIDMIPYILEFERRLGTDVLNYISQCNQIPFRISMASDLVGESIIDLAVGGGPVERFIAPTFADSLFSPVITRDHMLADKLANDLTWLVNNVIPSRSPDQMQQQPMVGYVHPTAQPAQYELNKGVTQRVADLGLL